VPPSAHEHWPRRTSPKISCQKHAESRWIGSNAVEAELSHALAPASVRHWITKAPAWLEIHDIPDLQETAPTGLDPGEAAAIALASRLHADLVLIDERLGFRVAQQMGLRVTGTLGVLDLAAERGLVDFAEAIRRLEQASFRRPLKLLKVLLAKHSRDRT
jgi:predicted nucleic acid-binding protein